MDKTINDQIKEFILCGDFISARSLLIGVDRNEQARLLIFFAWKTESLAFYGFILNVLLEHETAYWHSIASQIFMVPLCFINGADAFAIYHVKKAIKFDTTNVEYKQGLLMYYNHNPEPLLGKDEALQIINEILALDPKNLIALDALMECNNNKIKNVVIDKNDFSSLLYYGRFEEARELVNDFTFDQLFEVLRQINQKEQTITVYGYVVSLLLENETAALHHLASRVLVELLNSIKGADISAFWHAKRVVELDRKMRNINSGYKS